MQSWTGPEIARKLKCSNSSIYAVEKKLGFKPDYYSDKSRYRKVKLERKAKSEYAKPEFNLEDYFQLDQEDQPKFREKVIGRMRPLAKQGMSLHLILAVVSRDMKVSKNVALICQRSTNEIRSLLSPFRKQRQMGIKNPKRKPLCLL